MGTRNPKLPIEPHAFAAILTRRGHAAPKNERPMPPEGPGGMGLGSGSELVDQALRAPPVTRGDHVGQPSPSSPRMNFLPGGHLKLWCLVMHSGNCGSGTGTVHS